MEKNKNLSVSCRGEGDIPPTQPNASIAHLSLQKNCKIGKSSPLADITAPIKSSEIKFPASNGFRYSLPLPNMDIMLSDSIFFQNIPRPHIPNASARPLFNVTKPAPAINTFGQGNSLVLNDPLRSKGPIALSNGIIQIHLRNGIRVDMTLDKSVRVINTLSKITISLSNAGDKAAVNHPNGKVYQIGQLVEIIAFDGRKNNNYVRNAKMSQDGISFTCTNCTHVFLVDLYGTRTISDTFTNTAYDYTLPVFLNDSKHGPIYANEARTIVQRSSHFHSNDGTDEYYVNDFRISQKTDGLVKVTRSNNRCLIRTSPEHHSVTLTTPHFHCTASLSHTPHLFVRRQEQSMHFDGSNFVVRNNGHSAGFDENNYLRVY